MVRVSRDARRDVALVEEHRGLLSNDLGALAGLLFDLGQGRYQPPPPVADPEASAAWARDLATVRAEAASAKRVLDAGHPGADAVRLIDVLWVDAISEDVVAAFEVEHTTSIYSGIVRLLDLALGAPERTTRGLFLVAPDAREDDVRAQLQRHAFQGIRALQMRFLPYSELERNRDAMARFGRGLHPVEAVARTF